MSNKIKDFKTTNVFLEERLQLRIFPYAVIEQKFSETNK